MTYTVKAYVVTSDGRQDKTFTSEYRRGARWKAARWINQFLHPIEWMWAFTPIINAYGWDVTPEI